MKKTTAAVVWMVCGVLTAQSPKAPRKSAHGSAVTVTEGVVTMPTYERADRELQPPLFPGSSVAGIYPFTTYTGPVSLDKDPVNYKALFIENEYLKLTYIPELGGRFMEMYDKLHKREVFYKNDVLKPTQFNPRNNWPQEGIELTGPYDMHSLTWHNEPYWSHVVRRESDGSITIMLGESDPIYGMQVTFSATLHPGVAALQLHVFCFNPNTSRMPQMFWTNAAFPVTLQTQFLYPMSRTIGHNTGDVTDWPWYHGVDYSWARNNKNMLGVFGINTYDNYGGGFMYDQDYGVFRYGDRRVVQGMKMWNFGNGRDGDVMERSYTDKAGPYFEAQSGRHVWDGHYEWVAPHQVVRWSEWWIPVAGTKGLSTLSENAALNLRVKPAGEGSDLAVDLATVRTFAGATLTVSSSSSVLLKRKLNLSPANEVHLVVNSTVKPADLRSVQILLADAKGKTLLQYYRPDPGVKLSEYTPFTSELEKPTIKPEDMTAEEAMLAAEFRLKDLDDSGALHLLDLSLARDPGYSVAHTLKGIIFYKEGKLKEAEAELLKAVDRNPYNDRAWYYLCVTEIDLGQTAKAERSLYYIWPNSAYYGDREFQLGRLAFLKHEYATAEEHLKGAINYNGEDLSAHHLLAIVYRLQGNAREAKKQLARLEQIDPDYRGRVTEEYFLTRSAASATELRRLMGDQSQEALRVSAFYSDLQQWKQATTILELVQGKNGDPYGTSAVYYYTLAYDLQQSGDATGAKANREKARASANVVDRFPALSSSLQPLRAAVATEPTDVVARLNLGFLLYFEGHREEALAEWQAAEKVDPKDFTLQRSLGLAESEQGNTSSAITHLQAAVALKPGHLGTINDLASLYGKAGRFNDELALLRDSLSHTDQKDDLMLHLLHLYLVHGNYADAEQIVTTHTFAPKHRDYQLRDEYRALKYAETAQAFAKRDYATALKLVDEVENPPASLGVDDFQFASTPQMDYYRGRILEALGRKAEADEAYDKCVKSVDLKSGEMESFAGSNFYIVLALNKLGQHQEAEKVAAQFETYARTQLDLQRSTRKANGHYTLGLIALFHGDKKTAESEMHLALKAEPDFLPPIFDLRGDAIGTALVAK